MNEINKWTFPEEISFEIVPEYIEKFNEMHKWSNEIIFDLSNTKNIHSSFIGFLLYIKNHINKNGGNLIIIISQHVEKILEMLNIKSHFFPEIQLLPDKKSA